MFNPEGSCKMSLFPKKVEYPFKSVKISAEEDYTTPQAALPTSLLQDCVTL